MARDFPKGQSARFALNVGQMPYIIEALLEAQIG